MREYIVPNWHVVLVHTPLGLLSMGLLIELFCLVWRKGTLKLAGRWMILLGAVTAVPALTSGIYAYRDTLIPYTDVRDPFVDGDTWAKRLKEVTVTDRTSSQSAKEVPLAEFQKSAAGKDLWEHLLYNCISVGGIFFSILVYIACADRWRTRLYVPLLLVLLASKGLLIFGTHLGGLAVYEHGAAIKPVGTVVEMKPTLEEKIKTYIPPAQIHFALAGLVVAVSLVAIALSLRATTEGGASLPYEDDPFRDPDAVTGPGISSAEVHPPGTGAGTAGMPVPTSRFWLLAALFAILTGAAGVWMTNKWHWLDLKEMLLGENRNLFHGVLGVAIVAFALILALATRFARRSRLLISLASLLLVGSLGLQVFVGVMLTFDSGKGPEAKTTVEKLTSPFKFKVSTKVEKASE